jgi:hypothetical protein
MPPQTQSTKGTVIKGKAPVNKNILKVKLPKEQEAKLTNGLTVVLLEDHKVPTFTMQMVFMSGGLADAADYHGLASFTATLLREGTTKRSSKDIAEQTEALGTTLTANSGLSSLTSTVTTFSLRENLDQTLDLFADAIRNPTFPQAEVDKYKPELWPNCNSNVRARSFGAGAVSRRLSMVPTRAFLLTPPQNRLRTGPLRISPGSIQPIPSCNNAILAVAAT